MSFFVEQLGQLLLFGIAIDAELDVLLLSPDWSSSGSLPVPSVVADLTIARRHLAP